jgi:hypothetical protein
MNIIDVLQECLKDVKKSELPTRVDEKSRQVIVKLE